MSKKSRKKSSSSQEGRPLPQQPPPFNPRAHDAMMRQIMQELERQNFTSPEQVENYLKLLMVEGLPDPEPRTPLELAHELVDAAYQAEGEEQLQLLVRALATSWDCVDAYIGLANFADMTAGEAVSMYDQAVRAAERNLDPRLFEEAVGNFWLMFETRPYMRAAAGKAFALLALDEIDEAIAIINRLFELNPNDNMGLRYDLLHALLDFDYDEEAAALVERFPDDGMAAWLFDRALLAYRNKGNDDDARLVLQEAIEANEHVPGFLLGRKKMRRVTSEFYSPGDVTEAMLYCEEMKDTWMDTPGAIGWLEQYSRG